MIWLITIASFFFVLFLMLRASTIFRTDEDKLGAKIADRLKTSGAAKASVQIEKKERLSDMSFFDRLLRKINRTQRLKQYIQQSGLAPSVGAFILFSLLGSVVSLFVSLLFKISFGLAMLLAFGVVTLPFLFLLYKKASGRKKFSNRFPDAIGLIVSSLRAGHSIQIAVEMVVEEARDIVSAEFETVLSQVRVGQNFEDALKGMLDRMDTPELRLFIAAVILQRETGGNLAELLENLEGVIRERQELRRELKAATAQARLSGTVLSLLPLFVAFAVSLIHPDYMSFFFTDPVGTKLLTGSVIGQVFGVLLIQKIVHMEI